MRQIVYASKRTSSILVDCQPQAIAAAPRAEIDSLAGAGAGGIGIGASDGARGHFAAAGPANAAGHSELDLA